MCDDTLWVDELLDKLKRQSQLIFTREGNWISGNGRACNVQISLARSKKAIIGFIEQPQNAMTEYAANVNIQNMINNNELDSGRLILVKITEGADTPHISRLFTEVEASDLDLMPKILEALRDCDNLETPCQERLKKMILKGAGTSRQQANLEKECSIDIFEDTQSSVGNEFDCYVASCDDKWEDEVCTELKKKNKNLKVICRKKIIPNWPTSKRKHKKVLDDSNNLLEPVHSTKTTIVGFKGKKVNGYLKSIAEAVIKRQFEDDDFGCLIPVKIKRDAVIPSCVKRFRPLNAFEDNFHENVWQAVTRIEFDCYIVSCDDNWEKKVCTELEKRNNKLKVSCRYERLSSKSLKQKRMKTLGNGDVLDTLLQPILGTKKIIIGFNDKEVNGYLKRVALTVLERQCELGDNYGGLIPIQMKQDASIPFSVKSLALLKAFDDNFHDEVWKAVTSISVQVNVKCINSSSNFKEINDILQTTVEKFQKRHSPLHDKISKYIKEIGLKFNGITYGSIILHLSTQDPVALRRLSDSKERETIINRLAHILLPPKLQKEFCQNWSLNIDMEKYDAALTELKTHNNSQRPESDTDED
ncbi:uncharacterized protein LOC117103386 [Anneissia japonica]|uniref:uncharacterized protein LOC117103386 n=1 Tax=Anneissia japonica TaxID=1529436 RepID=UPI001425B812|nr:uncharacterized protein LOC117103386 [Anneissia japonica]